jgi:hypothetical protein
MRGSTTSKGRRNLSADTSGANLLPGRSNLHQNPLREPEWEPGSRDAKVLQGRWWQNLPEKLGAGRARRTDRARKLREVDHQAEHPDIPLNLVEALQRGTDPDEPLTSVTVTIDDQHVHVAISARGTGIPEPDSQTVWDSLCTTYHDVARSPYCADVVLPLPQEIAAIGWTTAGGKTVNITPCKAVRPRRLLSIALFPLARLGDLMALPAAGSAAALVLGTSSLAPVPVPAEPTPDLLPKTSIARRLPQAAKVLRPEPVKVRVQVRRSAPVKAKPPTRTGAPHPAVAPKAHKAAPAPASPSTSQAPTERPEVAPEAPETTPPAIPAVTGLETLLSSVPPLMPDQHRRHRQ